MNILLLLLYKFIEVTFSTLALWPLQERFPADQDLKSPIWDRQGPPVVIWADAWVVSWEETLGTAGLPPVNPVVSGESTRIRLIPYGAAKLHIAEFLVTNMPGV